MHLSRRARHYLSISCLLIVGFALRTVALDSLPPGLSHDEAHNGIAALQVLDGARPVFVEINKGIEPLIIYLEALAFYSFGIGATQLRLVNMMAGMLTIALVYPLTRLWFNRRVAWLTVAGIALSFWAIFVSRLTLRAVLLPPLLMLTVYTWWYALKYPRSRSVLWSILTGLLAGLTMYTYLSARFMPLLLAVMFGWQLLCKRLTRWHWMGLALMVTIWAIMVSPLANYYLTHPDSFSRRSDQVTTIPTR